MISTKLASIIAVAAFAGGSLFAPPVQQAIAAVIATDVQCTGCVGASDIAGNAVTAAKIKDGEVKAAEIATDAVGASELQGVTKLLYGVCNTSELDGFSWNAGLVNSVTCTINGAATGDSVIAMLNGKAANQCYTANGAWVDSANTVKVGIAGGCTNVVKFVSTGNNLSVIVYHK